MPSVIGIRAIGKKPREFTIPVADTPFLLSGPGGLGKPLWKIYATCPLGVRIDDWIGPETPQAKCDYRDSLCLDILH